MKKSAYEHRRIRLAETIRILALYPIALFLLVWLTITSAGLYTMNVKTVEEGLFVSRIALTDTINLYGYILFGAFLWIYGVAKYSNKLAQQNLALNKLCPEVCEKNNLFRLLELYNMIKGLSITTGIKTPTIYINNDNNINASTYGDRKHGFRIIITTGAIEKLSMLEMKALIAHEIGHIVNNDVFNQMLVDEAGVFISNIGKLILSFGGVGTESDLTLLQLPLYISCLIIGNFFILFSNIVSPLFSFGVSRKMEYRADATGCCITKDVNSMIALLSALYVDYYDKDGVKNNNFVNTAKTDVEYSTGNINVKFYIPMERNHWYASHPSVTSRIKSLRNMQMAD